MRHDPIVIVIYSAVFFTKDFSRAVCGHLELVPPTLKCCTEIVFGGVSGLDSSSAIGSDESQYYIMPLALTQGTSDGKHCPWPSLRVTHWHTPNMVREHEFHKNLREVFSPNVLVGKWRWQFNCLETHSRFKLESVMLCVCMSFTCLDLFWSCLSMKDSSTIFNTVIIYCI